MKIFCVAAFDPASVVLSHRDLLRKAGHDFRLAVVRAYTERQRNADYVLHTLHRSPVSSGAWSYSWEAQDPNLDELREFARQADVIQFHPGIGMGDGDWASQDGKAIPVDQECRCVIEDVFGIKEFSGKQVYFMHGSWATRANLGMYQRWLKLRPRIANAHIATSTIDYATELDATYLPPFVDVGDLRAPLRQDDDPLVIAHTPTDRIACSTDVFLEAARGAGAVVRLGEGLPHKDVLALKVECSAGFDHLRGAFSVNTLENAALGLAPLFALKPQYAQWALEHDLNPSPYLYTHKIESVVGLAEVLRFLSTDAVATRELQKRALSWWHNHFAEAPITRRLLKFYESL